MRDVGEAAAVQLASRREVAGQPQGVVGGAEGERGAGDTGELERFEDHGDPVAPFTDEGVGGHRGVGEGEPTDVGAADAVRADLRQGAPTALR